MTVDRSPLPSDGTDYLALARDSAVTPRDAATVVLLRDGDQGLESYFLRRHKAMAFAAGMYVFPGGGVDPRDADASIRWIGPPVDAWADRFSCSESMARELVCAAVRETFEESGVLLAGDEHGVVADTTGDDWETDRVDLEENRLSFADFLQRRGLALRADLLGAWAHWITPPLQPRRFDTRFFIAVLPEGQRTRDVSTESDDVQWAPVREALALVEKGEMSMMVPTATTCREIAEFDDTASVLAASSARRISAINPKVVREGDEYFLETEIP